MDRLSTLSVHTWHGLSYNAVTAHLTRKVLNIAINAHLTWNALQLHQCIPDMDCLTMLALHTWHGLPYNSIIAHLTWIALQCYHCTPDMDCLTTPSVHTWHGLPYNAITSHLTWIVLQCYHCIPDMDCLTMLSLHTWQGLPYNAITAHLTWITIMCCLAALWCCVYPDDLYSPSRSTVPLPTQTDMPTYLHYTTSRSSHTIQPHTDCWNHTQAFPACLLVKIIDLCHCFCIGSSMPNESKFVPWLSFPRGDLPGDSVYDLMWLSLVHSLPPIYKTPPSIQTVYSHWNIIATKQPNGHCILSPAIQPQRGHCILAPTTKPQRGYCILAPTTKPHRGTLDTCTCYQTTERDIRYLYPPSNHREDIRYLHLPPKHIEGH